MPRLRRWIALACACLGLLVAAGPARADCGVVPGTEGEVATWLLAGPTAMPAPAPGRTVDDALAEVLARPGLRSVRPVAGGESVRGVGRWVAAASDGTRLDEDATLHGQRAHAMLAGIELVADTDVALQLFVGSDDGLAVLLDGREIYRRALIRGARDDDDRVPLPLSSGHHTLVLVQYVRGGAAHLVARFVDASFVPTNRVRFTLPGVDDTTCDALGLAALHASVTRTATPDGTRVRIEASFPGGTARRADEHTRSFRIAPTASADVALDGPSATAATLEVDVPAATHSIAFETTAGVAASPARSLDVALETPVRHALVRASALLAALDEEAPPGFLPRESLRSVRFVADRLAQLVADGDPDRAHLLDESRTLESLLDAIAARTDPYAARRGALRRAYRSTVDGSLQGYSIFVPPSYRADRAFPVVVALHGLGGSAHRMLPVLFGLYDEHDSRTHADRHLPDLPDTHALLVAPYGFGDTGYRQLGETDVMAVLDDVRRAYRTDVDRTYITGLSMGGIGAASVPLHHPEVFAAAAPLCGYHSYFVRSDTRGVRRPWETALMEARSNVSWAENGLHLPLYVVHGTLDRPTDNSRVLVDRYTALGYAVESEWPELGHNVWSTTYAQGRIVPYFARFHRDPAPRHVRLRTAGMRWRTSGWVTIDALHARGGWGDVDATAQATGLRVESHGIDALTLSPPASLFTAGAARAPLRIDGDLLEIALDRPASLARAADGHWRLATLRTSQPATGPIRDVFDGPLAVVYGTHALDERAMDLRVARAWASIHPGVHAHVPVVADDDVTEAFARTHTLVLVGTERSNGYLARVAARLPIHADGDALVSGALRWSGTEVGAVFVAPNPDAPDRLLLVVTGVGPLGVWRSRFLPDLVPDFVVYDARIASARGRVLLGPHASVLAAGFLGANGSLPADPRDPDAATTSTTAAGTANASDNEYGD